MVLRLWHEQKAQGPASIGRTIVPLHMNRPKGSDSREEPSATHTFAFQCTRSSHTSQRGSRHETKS